MFMTVQWLLRIVRTIPKRWKDKRSQGACSPRTPPMSCKTPTNASRIPKMSSGAFSNQPYLKILISLGQSSALSNASIAAKKPVFGELKPTNWERTPVHYSMNSHSLPNPPTCPLPSCMKLIPSKQNSQIFIQVCKYQGKRKRSRGESPLGHYHSLKREESTLHSI